MHLRSRVVLPLLVTGLGLGLAQSASAAKLTLGSDLSGSPDQKLIEAQGADTAFWFAALNGQGVEVPEDGQVLSIKVKGSAVREKGAKNDPNNYVAFQTLGPADATGTRIGYLSSQTDATGAHFRMPVDQPEAITEFVPVNLCVQKGGTVAFNTMGGFGWGGGDPFDDVQDPYDPNAYRQGTPWNIFASAPTTTALSWYSKDAGTRNGLPHTPSGGTSAHDGYGATVAGSEILMQVVIGTGDDRSEPCGGPRRHPDGTLVDTSPLMPYMKVADVGGKPQRPYVTKDRKFTTGVYCGPAQDCAGTAAVLLGKRVIASAPFTVKSMSSGKIPMRLKKKHYRKLDRSKKRTLKVTFVLTTSFGTFTKVVTLKR